MSRDFAQTSSKSLLILTYRQSRALAKRILLAGKLKITWWLLLPLSLLLFLLIGCLVGVFLLISATSIKADVREQQAMSHYLQQLDLQTMQKIATLVADYRAAGKTVILQVNGEKKDSEGVGVYSQLRHYLIYFDNLLTEYSLALIQDKIAALHQELNQINVKEIKEENTLVVELRTQTLTQHLQAQSSSSDAAVAAAARESLSYLDTLSQANLTAQVLANPFADTTCTWQVSSQFGYRLHPKNARAQMHTGVDIPQPANTRIQAVLPGKVHIPNYDATGYGNWLITDNGEIQIYYAHLNRITVSEGQMVNVGETVGLVGSTGDSTGNHLHLEYRQNGEPMDPLPLLSRCL